MSEFSIAAIAGLVGGITEFLPVSSTGHMILLEDKLEFHGDLAAALALFIQLGAVLAVGFIYREKYRKLIHPGKWFRKPVEFSVWHIVSGIVPTVIVLYLAQGLMKRQTVSYFTVILGLMLGSVLMLLVEKFCQRSKTISLETMTVRQALLVGLFQIISLWPGFSQTAPTISGGLFWGLDRKSAVDFSFMIALPLMMVEVICNLDISWIYLENADLQVMIAGFAASLAAAYLSASLFLKTISKSVWVALAYYRLILAGFSYYYFFGH